MSGFVFRCTLAVLFLAEGFHHIGNNRPQKAVLPQEAVIVFRQEAVKRGPAKGPPVRAADWRPSGTRSTVVRLLRGDPVVAGPSQCGPARLLSVRAGAN